MPRTARTWTRPASGTTCAAADPTAPRAPCPVRSDPSAPADRRPVELDGSVYFGWESPTWGGGIAFYDPDAGGTSLGVAYLITAGQFADVATQEMHRDPTGDPLDLVALVAAGRLVLGPGRYETLHVVGEIDECGGGDLHVERPRRDAAQPAPAGVRHHHGQRPRRRPWSDVDEAVDYLLARPGCTPYLDPGGPRRAVSA